MRTSFLNTFQRKAKPFLAMSLASLLALSSTSCLKSDEKEETPQDQDANAQGILKSASIRVKIPEATGFDLRDAAERVRVNVVRSLAGEKAEVNDEPLIFPLSADEVYTLSEVNAGDVFILVDLLNDEGAAIASGELRTDLRPNSVPEVEVQLIPLPLELGLTLALNNAPAAEVPTTPAPVASSEPAEVKAALKSSGCLGCHSTRSKLGGLALDAFPYVTTNPRLIAGGNAAVMAEVVDRVTSAEAPMPPSGLSVKAENVALFDQFRTVLETAAVPPATTPLSPAVAAVQLVKLTVYLDEGKTFTTDLGLESGTRYLAKDFIDVVPGKSYLYDLTVYGQDATVLREVKKASFDVPLSGQVELNLAFEYPRGLNQPVLDITPPQPVAGVRN